MRVLLYIHVLLHSNKILAKLFSVCYIIKVIRGKVQDSVELLIGLSQAIVDYTSL